MKLMSLRMLYQRKHVTKFFQLRLKYFSVAGKLKSSQNKLSNIFEDEKENDFLTVHQISQDENIGDELSLMQEEIVNESQSQQYSQQDQKQLIVKSASKFSNLKAFQANNNLETPYYNQKKSQPNKSHDEMIENMIQQQRANTNKLSLRQDLQNTNQQRSIANMNNDANSSQQGNNKRNKIKFLRSGMSLSLYLKKPKQIPNAPANNFTGYVYFELKENINETEDLDQIPFPNLLKDPRGATLRPIDICKFLLLDPKRFNPQNLQRIELLPNKGKYIEVVQTLENRFIFTIEALKDVNEEKFNPEMGNSIISTIELNPEDIILFQKFLDISLNQLMNL